jgi:hypothetical protein
MTKHFPDLRVSAPQAVRSIWRPYAARGGALGASPVRQVRRPLDRNLFGGQLSGAATKTEWSARHTLPHSLAAVVPAPINAAISCGNV